jgi:hypothetical protein
MYLHFVFMQCSQELLFLIHPIIRFKINNAGCFMESVDLLKL